jgi:hypothetical protein
MTQLLFTNNAQSALASSISNTATSITVLPGGGVLFPNPGAGQGFYATLTDVGTGLIREIVLVTGRTGDTMNVIRAQQGTTALNWNANDLFAKLWTAGDAQAMLQQGDAQAQAGNYAVDTGVTNAYSCVLNPAISSPIPGMPIRLRVANTNTGASTFNPGSGVGPIVRANGTPCIGGELIAGLITELMWVATGYQIMTGPVPASASTVGGNSDNGSFLTPGNLFNAFPFVFTTTGYVLFPGGLGTRPVFEFGQAVVNTGTAGGIVFPVAMTGGLLSVQITPNFTLNFTPSGLWYSTGAGPTGFSLNNQTGGNGNFDWLAFGRA